MRLGLKGRAALVTAASSGLGRAVARALCAEGCAVAICSRDERRIAEAARKIVEDGPPGSRALGYRADVTDEGDLRELISGASADLGALDILVCNAGGPPPGGFSSLDERDWERAFSLTLMSVVRTVRLALPHLRKSERGTILAVVSSSVKRPLDNLLLSNVFRPAVQGLCKSLSIELAPEGIRVNCLAPGRIETDRTDEVDRAKAKREGIGFEEVRRRSVAGIPMGRLGTPGEFGKLAAILCSDTATYVTGSTLLVDGGAVRCL